MKSELVNRRNYLAISKERTHTLLAVGRAKSERGSLAWVL